MADRSFLTVTAVAVTLRLRCLVCGGSLVADLESDDTSGCVQAVRVGPCPRCRRAVALQRKIRRAKRLYKLREKGETLARAGEAIDVSGSRARDILLWYGRFKAGELDWQQDDALRQQVGNP